MAAGRKVQDVFQELGNTEIYHEIDFKFNAPHHYIVLNKHECKEPLGFINFQEGAISEVGINGVQNIDLLAIVKNNLEHFQKSEFACRENAIAITHIETAMAFLAKRTLGRIQRSVEGTHQV